jgi:hypothetical protein
MATTTYYLRGKCKWAKPYKMDPEYRTYSIDVFLDEGSMKLFKESGCQLKIRKNEEGEYVSFRRSHEKLIKGKPVVFGPVTVVDAAGQPWDPRVLIGNGSVVDVCVTMYDTPKGKGTTLERIRVLDLVEYDTNERGTELAPGISDPF